MGKPAPPSLPYPRAADTRRAVIRRNADYVQRRIWALEDAQARELAAMLRQSNDRMTAALVNAIMQNGGTWNFDANYSQRTAALMQQINRELDDLLRAAQETTLTAMENSYKGSYYGRAWVMDNALRTGTAINLPMLPSAAIRSALLSPYGGLTFIDRFADARDDFVRRIRKAIAQSQINGDSIPQAVKRLADELGINVGRGGVERGLRARLEMIARTEILRSSNMGAMAIYQANQDVLEGWEWIATKDERTCDICGPRDGKQYPFDSKAEQPPAHPNCRCSVSPVLIDSELEKRIVGKQETWEEWKARRSVYDDGGTVSGKGKSPPKVTPPKIPLAEQARKKLSSISDKYDNDLKTLRSGIEDETKNMYRLDAKIGEAIETHDDTALEKLNAEWQGSANKVAAMRERENQMRLEYSREARKIVSVDDQAKIEARLRSRFESARRTTINEGVNSFENLVSRRVMGDARAVNFYGNQRGRAYYSQGGIYIDKRSRARTVVHEMGHWLEDMNPAVHDSAIKFLERRTAGEEAKSLRSVTKVSAYRRDEVTKVDKFIDPYIGKIYRRPNGEYHATEVVSMGLEYMHADAAMLAKSDPDYFDFIYNIVRGIYP